MRPLALVLAGLATLTSTIPVFADPPPPPRIPEQRISYDFLAGLRLNPLGLEFQYNLAYRHRLYASDSTALRDNYFGVVLAPTVNPTMSRMGGAIELRPLSMLALSGGIHHVGNLGVFDNLVAFPDAGGDWSDTGRDRLDKAGQTHPANGFEVFARAAAIAKIGPIVIRDDLLFTYSDIGLPNDGVNRVYYHPRFDMLVPDKGWFMHNDSDLLYLSDFGLIAGARSSLTNSFFDESTRGDGDDLILRVGPLVAYTFFDHPGASWNKPTLIGIAQWWVLHPWRTGEDVHQGIPYATLAFRFEGDLFRSDN
ncbi:MAG: hypothetical protein U0271_20460 [Polyangiaceae bacterium]